MRTRYSNTCLLRLRAGANAAAVFVLLVAGMMTGPASAAGDASVDANGNDGPSVQFLYDVVPLLTRLQCNSGGCHGKATGQNGFRLSLLGFEPDLDHTALVSEARGRRLFPAVPNRSLLLTKATGVVPHGGGRRLDVGSDDYRMLHNWIAAGAPQRDRWALAQRT